MTPKQAFSYFLHWIANVFLKTLKLRKRNANIWLFGAWRGRTYSDNSKYLFEYVNKQLPDIRAVWITKNPEVKSELLQQGKECYLFSEKKARQLRLKAGRVFFTNGAHDFGNFDLCQGALKIALWHGMPLKRIFFAANHFYQKKGFLQKIQYTILKIYNKAERQISIATSETTQRFIAESFEVRPDSVWITGQPRNDALFHQKTIQSTRKKLELKPGEKMVLYMPTWRETGSYDDFFQNNSSFLDEIIKRLNNDKAFLSTLNDLNITLFIKPHPNRVVKAKTRDRIRIITQENDGDPQQLLAAADSLITDYSSAFIDFALTQKPIHFYVPDLMNYSKGHNGLFLEFNQFAEFWFEDLNGLKDAVLGKKKTYKQGLANMHKINRLFDDQRLKRGDYCNTFIKTFHTKIGGK